MIKTFWYVVHSLKRKSCKLKQLTTSFCIKFRNWLMSLPSVTHGGLVSDLAGGLADTNLLQLPYLQ